MTITKIGFRNFRSVGDEPVILDLTKKVNVLIGPNNAGKSTVIAACERWVEKKFTWPELGETDRHKRQGASRVGIVVEGDWKPASEAGWPKDCFGRFEFPGSDNKAFRVSPFESLDFDYFNAHKKSLTGSYYPTRISQEQQKQEIAQLANQALVRLAMSIPKFINIPAFRRIADGEYAVHGTGIVELLSHWRNPDIGKESNESKFQAVEEFLRHLIEMPTAQLEVPPENPRILVRRDGLRLPIENYGTGLHELVILAVAVLQHEGVLIAIEEPEIHLHPRLQRELLRFLIERTKNNYLITTHSPAFLSRPQDCHIVRLWLEEGVTRSKTVETTSTALDVLRDLGVSAADVMQTRFVIWVEGPSDAVYLRRWLDLAHSEGIAPDELLEGIDYSIMFYGGACRSHLSVERDGANAESEPSEDAKKLISLLPINQNAAFLMDSDRKSEPDGIDTTKQRIQNECSQARVVCWISSGREIENYLSVAAVEKAFSDQLGEPLTVTLEPWEKIGIGVEAAIDPAKRRPKFEYDKDKPGWARRIAPHIQNLDGSDLRGRIKELVDAIHAAR